MWWTHLAGNRRLFILTVRSGDELIAIAPFARIDPARREPPAAPIPGIPRHGHGRLRLSRRHRPPRLRGGRARTARNASRVGGNCRRARATEYEALQRGDAGESSDGQGLEPAQTSGWRLSVHPSERAHMGVVSRDARVGASLQLQPSPQAGEQGFRRPLRAGAFAGGMPCRARAADSLAQSALARARRLGCVPCSGGRAVPPCDELSWPSNGAGCGSSCCVSTVFPSPLSTGSCITGCSTSTKSGYDPRYRKQSVGLLTMGLAIKSAIEEGAEQYDMLHGDESYKFHWAKEVRELEHLELYAPDARDAAGPRGPRGQPRDEHGPRVRSCRERSPIGSRRRDGWASGEGSTVRGCPEAGPAPAAPIVPTHPPPPCDIAAASHALS